MVRVQPGELETRLHCSRLRLGGGRLACRGWRRLSSRCWCGFGRSSAGSPSTEVELRSLLEGADGWARVLKSQLQASEAQLAELVSDPASSIAALASELRRIEELRVEGASVRAQLEQLQGRARDLRTQWLSEQTASELGVLLGDAPGAACHAPGRRRLHASTVLIAAREARAESFSSVAGSPMPKPALFWDCRAATCFAWRSRTPWSAGC